MQLSPGDTLRRQDMKLLLIVIKKNLVNCSGNVVHVDGLLKMKKQQIKLNLRNIFFI